MVLRVIMSALICSKQSLHLVLTKQKTFLGLSKFDKNNKLPGIRLQILDLMEGHWAYSSSTCLRHSSDGTAVACLCLWASRRWHLTLQQVWAAARITWNSSWDWETSLENCSYWRGKHVPVLPLGTVGEKGLGVKAHPFSPSLLGCYIQALLHLCLSCDCPVG